MKKLNAKNNIWTIVLVMSLFLTNCQKETQIEDIKSLNPQENNLVAYYPFNGNANDESGNQFNGKVINAILTTDRFNNKNSAYSFNTNQYIIVPNTEDQNIFPISISLWYMVDSILNDERCNIFSKYAPAAWNGYQIKTADYRNVGNNDGNGNTYFNNGFATNSWYIRNPQNRILGFYNEAPFLQQNIFFNKWYHYVFVVDEYGGKVYANGKLITAHSWTGNSGPCNNSYNWKIGGDYNAWFKGKIDDIRIYNTALSQDDVIYLFNQ